MAIALTKDEWVAKLKTWSPVWFSEGPQALAVLNGLAQLLADAGDEVDWMISETFITEATDNFLASLGDERSVYQLPAETTPAFRSRVQASATASYCPLPAVLALVQALTPVDPANAWVRDEFSGGLFADEGSFCDRRDVLLDVVKDGFAIFVDHQTDLQTLQLIADSVQAIKAFGTVFRLIERVS